METLGKQRVRISEKDSKQVISVKLKIADIIDEMEYLRDDKNTTPESQER